MEPLGTEWVEEMKLQIRDNIEYYPLYRRWKVLESELKEVVKAMTPQQQKVIADYIHVLRKMEVCLSKHSYLAGCQTARRREQ